MQQKRPQYNNNQRPKNKSKKRCYFTAQHATYIDYKNIRILSRYITMFARIMPRRYTGVHVKYQGMLAQAIKRARLLGLLPYTMQHRQYPKHVETQE
ncbi:MAG: 30S ribosomal protein S18 [Candidatus Abawacabacteria bacterium]|nr:30S ribosomal protein S18 [Candidatus Abawacabacteria bacterium]